LIDDRAEDVCGLGEYGVAIVALTATSDEDPLAFLKAGGPTDRCGWVGKYEKVGASEMNKGYGPATYLHNPFLLEVAERLRPITPAAFAANCNLDWLDKNNAYPGGWHADGKRHGLIMSFIWYRDCVLTAAEAGNDLLMWCADSPFLYMS
jgi:hypothetical protein